MNELLTVKEAANALRLHPGTLYNWRWRDEGKGPRCVRVGSKVFYRRSDLLRYLEQGHR